MKVLLSPAKNMKRPERAARVTKPGFLREAQALLERLRAYESWQLEGLLKVSPKMAVEAYLNYQAMDLKGAGWPALLAYDGLVFRYLEAARLSAADLEFAQQGLCILSGMYGCLKPLDGIFPYRLEMQCKLAVDGKRDLYEFWGDKLYRSVACGEPVINLASEEYAGAVRKYLSPADRMTDVVFMSYYKGKYRVMAAWAKMARGRMARYIIENRLQEPEGLMGFCWDGYRYSQDRSSQDKYIFIRE